MRDDAGRVASDIDIEDEEAALVMRALADRQAFAALYARFVDPVYWYCYRRLGSVEAAEDATSQVFCQALAALPRYRQGSFAAWLFAIARRVAIDSHRLRRPDLPIEVTPEPADTAPTPEEFLLASEHRDALLAPLNGDQRRVVELRLIGLSGAEIAAALGRSHGAVKMLQLRALERLRAAKGAVREGYDGHNR